MLNSEPISLLLIDDTCGFNHFIEQSENFEIGHFQVVHSSDKFIENDLEKYEELRYFSKNVDLNGINLKELPIKSISPNETIFKKYYKRFGYERYTHCFTTSNGNTKFLSCGCKKYSELIKNYILPSKTIFTSREIVSLILSTFSDREQSWIIDATIVSGNYILLEPNSEVPNTDSHQNDIFKQYFFRKQQMYGRPAIITKNYSNLIMEYMWDFQYYNLFYIDQFSGINSHEPVTNLDGLKKARHLECFSQKMLKNLNPNILNG